MKPPTVPPPRPVVKHNVVIYLVDTLRADHLGVYGYERETSPRLDAFAKDAVVFERAYAPSSWTKPSTASLLTGLHPRRHGGITRDNKLADRIELLSEHLDALGYHTVAFMTNPNTVAMWGFDQGFDVFYDIHNPDHQPKAEDVANKVFEHMDAHADQPFFYYIHTLDPHDPYSGAGRLTPAVGRARCGKSTCRDTPRARLRHPSWPMTACPTTRKSHTATSTSAG